MRFTASTACDWRRNWTFRRGKPGRRIPILLQVNASEEGSKFGVAVGAAVHLGEQIDSMPNLQLVGLMTMAELEAPETKIRQTFARTRRFSRK